MFDTCADAHRRLIITRASLNLLQSARRSITREAERPRQGESDEGGKEQKPEMEMDVRRGRARMAAKYMQRAEIDGEKEMDNGEDGNCRTL